MSNHSGQAYGLTVLSPIIRDVNRDPAHEAEIRDFLEQLDRRGNSPLARVPTIHMARWTVIDDVTFQGAPTREEHLRSKYLLFSANLDGPRDETLRLMAERLPETLNTIYQHCVGFPGVGVGDARPFCQYITRCQVETTFFFADYPDARATDVLRALATQREFVPLVVRLQGCCAADVQREFQQFVQRRQDAPTPRPGTM